MKILVTGGCGFVGSNISLFLKSKNKNYNIETLDNFTRAGSKINFKRLKKFGIKNYNINIDNYQKILKLPKYDLIIDCCAEASVELSRLEMDRIFKTNLIGTFNILKKCQKDKSNIIFLSSSRVYSIESLNSLIKKKSKKITYKPKVDHLFDTNGPKSLYGFTKLSSEMLIKEFSFLYDIKFIINRIGVISGPWQFGRQDQGFVSLWIWRHITKKNLSYIGFKGNGYQMRDIIHIDDVCNLIFEQIKKIKKTNNLIFNVGGGRKNTISLSQLTSKVENITGNKLKIKKVKETSKYDIFYYSSDNRMIYSKYNWRIKNTIDKILNDTYKWLINNYSLLKKILK
tara:strand:- start:3 stop:1028 length:1026 start_codon:yes stop_codon:yes gene_type:complete